MLHYQQVLEESEQGKSELSIPERLLRLSRDDLYWEKEALFEDCEILQKALLREICQRAKGSAYAKDYGMENINNLVSWREKVPISTYDNYLPYINAEMNGSPHQLYAAETELYVATTGSTGKIKLFMESAAGNAAKLLVMAVRGMYMGTLLPVTRDMEAKNLTISNYLQLGDSPNGKPIMRASGQTARNLRKKTGTMNIISTQFWEISDISPQDREYMVAVFALAEKRLSKVFCNNLYAFGRVLDQIEQNEQQMVEDIRMGAFSIVQDPVLQRKLADVFHANEARAQELQALLDTQGHLINEPEDLLMLWPNCQMASGWLSGSVGRDAREVLQRMPATTKCFEMGYGASEGKLNIPTKLATASGAAAVFSVFYEFRPLQGNAEPLCLWEVEDGEAYELIITTYSGLYRYNMLDIVRIDGFTGQTPNLVFCGKSTEFVNLGDQKIYGYQFSDLVHSIEKKTKINFDIVQVFLEVGRLYYVVQSLDDVDYPAIKEMLDEQTRSLWQFESAGICVMKKAYKKHEFDKRLTKARGACGIKLPTVLKTAPNPDEIEKIIS